MERHPNTTQYFVVDSWFPIAEVTYPLLVVQSATRRALNQYFARPTRISVWWLEMCDPDISSEIGLNLDRFSDQSVSYGGVIAG